MGDGTDLSSEKQLFRWGSVLASSATVLIVVVPGLVSGLGVSIGGEQARVAVISAWPPPHLDVSFSMPSSEPNRLSTWAVEQLATAIYAVAVVVYYSGVGALGLGVSFIGVSVYRVCATVDIVTHSE